MSEEGEGGTFNIVFENDVLYQTDQHYTNGVELSWLSGPDYAPDWVLRGARLLPFFEPGTTVRTSFGLEQKMYTPSDITLEDPPRDDRPYAGWLNASVGLVAESDTRLDQLELAVGMVGPASLAEQTQTLVHKILDADEPQGWDTQLHNEPGVVLTYKRSWRQALVQTWGDFGIDVTPHVGGALGNVFTYANAGATLRFGQSLPLDYGPPRIQPSLPGAGFFKTSDYNNFGWYLFAGVDGRAVARNIFLDGNTFGDSRSVDKEILVGDLQFGASIIWGSVRLSYTHVLRTPEFDGQEVGDNFGAFSLSYHF